MTTVDVLMASVRSHNYTFCPDTFPNGRHSQFSMAFSLPQDMTLHLLLFVLQSEKAR